MVQLGAIFLFGAVGIAPISPTTRPPRAVPQCPSFLRLPSTSLASKAGYTPYSAGPEKVIHRRKRLAKLDYRWRFGLRMSRKLEKQEQ
jgi:hypothetical protein